jgi:hypothetical protein
MSRKVAGSPLLYITFIQFYLEPGSTYQFSHHFQGLLASRLTRTCRATELMQKDFPGIKHVCFFITAAKRVPKKQVVLTRHSRKSNSTEFTVYIPYSWTRRSKIERHQRAISNLIATIGNFLDGYGVDTRYFLSRESAILSDLASDTERYFDNWSLG